MRNCCLILFMLASIKAFPQQVVLKTIQNPQQINIFKDMPSQPIDMKHVIGDYWNKAEGYSVAVSFEKYCFFQDGTFEYQKGYSGGAYIVTVFEGKYTIDEKNGMIKLNTKKVRDGGHVIPSRKTKRSRLHTNLKIVGLNDTIVAIQVANDTMIYRRTLGCMKDQTWVYDKTDSKEYENDDFQISKDDWKHHIQFQSFGQFTYTAENFWNKYKSNKFVGGYHLHNNIIYLQIRSKSSYDSNTQSSSIQKFDPDKHTYIRVNTKENKVNRSDLMDLINDNLDKKDWVYKGGFKTKQPIPDSVNDEWVVITKR